MKRSEYVICSTGISSRRTLSYGTVLDESIELHIWFALQAHECQHCPRWNGNLFNNKDNNEMSNLQQKYKENIKKYMLLTDEIKVMWNKNQVVLYSQDVLDLH